MSQIINIKCTNGDKFAISTDLDQTVSDLKSLIQTQSSVPSDQQRLIYKGHVLQDSRTLSSYSIEGGQTVILVRGSKPRVEASPQPASSPAAAASSATPPAAFSVPLQPSANAPAPSLGAANPFGMPFPNTGFDFAQMQQQLLSNPEQMQAIMNSPMMQALMDNPEMIQNMFQSNPQFREIFDRNPELAQVLNDPAMIRQSMQMAANPNLMREMMRTTDRAMSNIEAHPEGFNALRRLYENVQEPMMEATADINRPQNANRQVPQQNQNGNNNSPSPNTAPLPNPWATQTNSQGNVAMPDMSAFMNGFVPQGQQGAAPNVHPFGGLMPNGFSPEMMSQLAQNPAFMQMMQQMLSDPVQMQAIINSNPLMRQMMESNPAMASMMTNPAILQSMANPAVIQSILQMAQNNNSNPSSTSAAQQPAINPFAGMFMPPPAAAAMPSGPSASSGVQPEILFRDQLSQLNDMGFTDAAANLRALLATGGNVHAAIDRLLQG